MEKYTNNKEKQFTRICNNFWAANSHTAGCMQAETWYHHAATGGILMHLFTVLWDGPGAVSSPPPRRMVNCKGSSAHSLQLDLNEDGCEQGVRKKAGGVRWGGENRDGREIERRLENARRLIFHILSSIIPSLFTTSVLCLSLQYCEKAIWNYYPILLPAEHNLILRNDLRQNGFSAKHNHLLVINVEQMTFCYSKWLETLANGWFNGREGHKSFRLLSIKEHSVFCRGK